MKNMTWFALVSVLAFGCDSDSDDADAGGRDASTTIDGGRRDAGMRPDSGQQQNTDSGMRDSGQPQQGGMHCEETGLIITAIDFTTKRITVLNPTDQDVMITSEEWCDQPAYGRVSTTGTTIPANSETDFTLPNTFPLAPGSGELALYSRRPFGNADNVLDFVCWGTPRAADASRRDEAEENDQWSGDCVGAVTGTELRRIADSAGNAAASWDPTGATPKPTCR